MRLKSFHQKQQPRVVQTTTMYLKTAQLRAGRHELRQPCTVLHNINITAALNMLAIVYYPSTIKCVKLSFARQKALLKIDIRQMMSFFYLFFYLFPNLSIQDIGD